MKGGEKSFQYMIIGTHQCGVETGRDSPPHKMWGKCQLFHGVLPRTSWHLPACGCKQCRLSAV